MNKDERRDVAQLLLELTMILEFLVNETLGDGDLKFEAMKRIDQANYHQKQFVEVE